MDHYTEAQVCLNGHSITFDTSFTDLTAKFCSECGEQTIVKCPSCNTSIRGIYHVEGVLSLHEYTPPRYCHNCGKPFPWTVKALDTANEFADEIDELSPAEKETLKQSISDLSSDSVRTSLAVTRFKKLLGKLGSATADSLGKIVTVVATEAAKKALGL